MTPLVNSATLGPSATWRDRWTCHLRALRQGSQCCSNYDWVGRWANRINYVLVCLVRFSSQYWSFPVRKCRPKASQASSFRFL